MKKLILAFTMTFVLFAFSCSSDDESEGQETLSTLPVSGTIYGNPFLVNAAGGKASNITDSGVESVYIYLTAEVQGCGAPDGYEFPVTILAPRAVGTHTSNVYAYFKDPNSGDFVNVSNLTVEIISVGDMVVGRVLASATTEECHINGKFEVPYCD